MTATNEDQSYWYECSFTYDGELYSFTSDDDVVAGGKVDSAEVLFYLADEVLPEDFNEELLSGVSCSLVREGDEYQ